MNKCGCGRSPTGFCIGWHSLSKEEFERKLNEHNMTLDVTAEEEEAFKALEKKSN
jgi:hypothetical protein